MDRRPGGLMDASSPQQDILLLRLDAPLLSFGGLAVDENRVSRPMPGRSMLTGLLANALGWHHGDGAALDRLQQRLDYAVRRDRRGEPLLDYQTVDLGQDFLHQGWTTRGRPEGRGGASSGGTHIRLRHYWAGAAFTVALTLQPATEMPDLDALQAALRRPARPLFLGRKTCLPSRPLLGHADEVDRLSAVSPLVALTAVPLWPVTLDRRPGGDSPSAPEPCSVWWSAGPTADPSHLERSAKATPRGVTFHRHLQVVDERRWQHQLHAGKRYLNEGVLDCTVLDCAELDQPAATQTPRIPSQGDLHA